MNRENTKPCGTSGFGCPAPNPASARSRRRSSAGVHTNTNTCSAASYSEFIDPSDSNAGSARTIFAARNTPSLFCSAGGDV